MKIVEKFCKGKLTEELCEDTYVITDDFVAVIDGVTSKSDFLFEGKTTGKMAAEVISRVIAQMPRETTCARMIAEINSSMKQLYQEISFPYDIGEMGMQAACVVYSDHYREIWMIGDCQAMVDGTLHLNPKKSDEILSDMRALAIECLNVHSAEDACAENMDIARNLIVPWILKATAFANDDSTEFGYAVINGEEIPESLIYKIKLDWQPHEVILTSDGYPVVERTLERSEQKLSEIIKKDPGCYKIYRSTKGIKEGCTSFDDRTYIRFIIGLD